MGQLQSDILADFHSFGEGGALGILQIDHAAKTSRLALVSSPSHRSARASNNFDRNFLKFDVVPVANCRAGPVQYGRNCLCLFTAARFVFSSGG